MDRRSSCASVALAERVSPLEHDGFISRTRPGICLKFGPAPAMSSAFSPSDLLHNAWDLHLHAGPDVVPRAQRADEVWADAREAGMAGIGLKDHCGSTGTLARMLDARAGTAGPRVIGSVTLNPPVGGFNPAAVEAALRVGARIVWMPTYASRRHLEICGPSPFPRGAVGRGLTIWAEEDATGGPLRSELGEILSLVAQHDAVLASGHLHPRESLGLFAAARAAGVRRMVLTHPALAVTAASLEVQREAVALGAWVEHGVLAFTRDEAACGPGDLVAQIRALGLERVTLCSDLGKVADGPVVAGFAAGLAKLREAGLEEGELRRLVGLNPARLLAGE